MPVNLSIKNVPDAMATKLRLRAERHHRSLQGELMAILERVTNESEIGEPGVGSTTIPTGPALSIDEVAQRARALFPKGTSSSTDFIRAMRDGRYGDDWARTGRHTEPE